ncbi:hypothetical protein [Paenibacillus sp. PAMC21692]|uniref:hypothetical protein n=1 Tax=Paenibacillus sp. PAMC21692 TaxID=2762320 RepID=UPI00164E9357|nr:hypothetical protein [Paenibacillus sp. PAMC21692]QNK58616.1 hypothetical protein H7F31_06860 [Paenibacillus sp. PAMC21692]
MKARSSGRRKKLQFILVLCMAAVIMITGCTSGNKKEEENSGQAGNQTTASQKPVEPVKLTIGSITSLFQIEEQYWPNLVTDEIKKKLGVEIEVIEYDDEKLKLALASGELPDILVTNNSYIQQLVEGKNVIALDEYLADHGKNIAANYPNRVSFSKKFLSNDTGNLYFLNSNAGPTGLSNWWWNGFIVRWDLYKEMGYPTIKNEDEHLAVLAEMQKKQPTTEDGKKVYGMGLFNDWGPWAYWVGHGANMGYANWAPHAYITNVHTNEISANYADTSSPLWANLKYLYKANKLGLLDPDSFTMKSADYAAKAAAGQYLSAMATWWIDAYSIASVQKDPNSLKGYVSLPVEGMTAWANSSSSTGWPGFLLSVTKNAENPEKAVELIDYLFSYDGVRTALSGIKGEDWDIVDGKAQMLPAAIERLQNPKDEDKKRGLGVLNNIVGITGADTHPTDGGLLDLRKSIDVLKLSLTPTQRDFSSHYGVDMPYQVHEKLMKEGKAFDQSNQMIEISNVLPQTPDDITRIDAKLDDIMMKGMPKVILSKSDEDYEKNMNDILKQLESAGAETSFAWWKKAWDDAKATVTSMK